MKLKIIFAPLTLIIAVGMFIYFVWPALNDVKIAQAKLKQSNADLQKAIARGQNIVSLKDSLDQNKDKEDLVLSFLPPQKNEERIIDTIDYLAKDSGVGVININIEKETQALPQVSGTVTAAESLSINSEGALIAPDGSIMQQLNEIKFLTTKINLTGDYENIKLFMDQVYKMEMFHSANSLSIKRQENQSIQPEVSPSALIAELDVNFGYLAPATLQTNAKLPVFEKNSFDLKPVEKLENLISKKVPVLEEGVKGKSNPFLP